LYLYEYLDHITIIIPAATSFSIITIL
jgi:hypothetical protein